MRYAVRKILGTIPLLLGLVTAVFFLLRLVPGGPAIAVLGERASPAAIAAFEAAWGLDRPLVAQYGDYVGGLLQGDFGRSYLNGSPVSSALARALPHSLLLMSGATLLSLVLGMTLGTWAALRAGRLPDLLSRIVAMIGFSVPDFYLAILLVLTFSLSLGWLPMQGAGEWSDPAGMALRLVMPTLALGLPTAAVVLRITRSAMRRVLPSDYLRTARSKGLSPTAAAFRHGLRNAAIPIVSVVGLNMGLILGNSIVIETVFSRPGLGRMLIGSIFSRDFATLQSTLVVYASAIALINTMTDLAYGWINPAVRYG